MLRIVPPGVSSSDTLQAYTSQQLVGYTSNTMTIVKVTFDFRLNNWIRMSDIYVKILSQSYRVNFSDIINS